MNLKEIQNLLQKHNVAFDSEHEKRTIQAGLELGLLSLKLVCHEGTGVYDPEDVPVMRKQGLLIFPAAYGVDVFEVVPTAESGV